MAQWDQDLASVQDSAAVPQPLQCDGSTVRMVRRATDGLQIVAWSYRPGDAGVGTWVRWAGPVVQTAGQLTDSWLRSLQLQGDEPDSLRTLTGMTGWQVYFYQSNGWANCQSTGNKSQTTGRVLPPSGVRVVLSFGGGGISGDLTRDTLLSH